MSHLAFLGIGLGLLSLLAIYVMAAPMHQHHRDP